MEPSWHAHTLDASLSISPMSDKKEEEAKRFMAMLTYTTLLLLILAHTLL